MSFVHVRYMRHDASQHSVAAFAGVSWLLSDRGIPARGWGREGKREEREMKCGEKEGKINVWHGSTGEKDRRSNGILNQVCNSELEGAHSNQQAEKVGKY